MLATLLIARSGVANEITLQEQLLDHPQIGLVEIKVPEGYQLEILDAELDHPRMIEFAPNGDMFIGSGKPVYKLSPPYTKATQFLWLETYPHSIAIRGDEMFIATISKLYRLPYDPEQKRAIPGSVKSNDTFTRRIRALISNRQSGTGRRPLRQHWYIWKLFRSIDFGLLSLSSSTRRHVQN